MAKQVNLENVYEVIGQLRAKGIRKLSVEQVAAAAGVARSTFYLSDADWQEVRDVINGKPSTRVKLIEVQATAATGINRTILELRERLQSVESELESVRQTAEVVFKNLVDQLQYYFALAAETPAERARQAKLLKEFGWTKQELKRLQAENASLREQMTIVPEIAKLVSKRYITLPNVLSGPEYYSSFLDQLIQNVPDEHAGMGIRSIFVTCGLPSSGKTRWVHGHTSSEPGGTLYIDGTSHSVDVRKFIADRLRRITTAPIHCVRIRASKETCAERCGRKLRGASFVQMEKIITSIDAAFEEVSIAEPFDSIILA